LVPPFGQKFFALHGRGLLSSGVEVVFCRRTTIKVISSIVSMFAIAAHNCDDRNITEQ
jgi:hypothetical protein